jgi:hypothetical protein
MSMINSLLKKIIFAAFAAALAIPAAAQLIHQRILPVNGKRAEVGAPQPLPLVQLGREIRRLAPGAVVYDQNNRAILQSALPEGAQVLYTSDAQGNVLRMYVLTPTEQAQLDAAGVR